MTTKTKHPAHAEKSNVPATIAPSPLATVDEETLAAVLEDAQAPSDFGVGDVAIPWLRILQANSPEVLRGNAKQVEGAEPSMFINTNTSEVFDGEEGVTVIPVYFTRSVTEWKPRATEGGGGGGFVKDHGTDESLFKETHKNDKNKDILPNGNELTRGALYYLLHVKEHGVDRVAMVLTSTQLKKAKKWNGLMQSQTARHPLTGQMIVPAPHYMSYVLTTVPENNAKGNWFGLRFAVGTPTLEMEGGQALYKTARMFRELIVKGEAKANVAAVDTAANDGGADAEGENTPF